MILFLPFLGLLLSMALIPQFLQHLWEKHAGKIVFFWVALCMLLNPKIDFYTHSFLEEYIPFISLIFALYSVSGGIHLKFKLNLSAYINTLYLFLSSIVSGIIGTTGASLLLIRPFLSLNRQRKYKTHLGIFYIFIVSNIGGALSTLGDPPLFVGHLKGIDFLWPTLNLWKPTFFALAIILSLFFALDFYLLKKETIESNSEESFLIEGKKNLVILLGVIIVSFLKIPLLFKSLALLFLGGTSYYFAPLHRREKWGFQFEPLSEVAKLFLGIFLTLSPIIDALKMGVQGPLEELFTTLKISPEMPLGKYFWVTGLLSSVLDNAPTYLVFFYIAGGDSLNLMGAQSAILKAISIGAVFMGALTYIGNAPNLMIRSIANHKGLKMPGFFGYILWSTIILVPIFYLIEKVFIG